MSCYVAKADLELILFCLSLLNSGTAGIQACAAMVWWLGSGGGT